MAGFTSRKKNVRERTLLRSDVIHTVGPIARGHLTDTHKENLANCYKSSLKLAKENNIRSIVEWKSHRLAFPVKQLVTCNDGIFLGGFISKRPSPASSTRAAGFLQVPETIEITYPILAKYSRISTKNSSVIAAPCVVPELGSLDVLVRFIIIPFLCSVECIWGLESMEVIEGFYGGVTSGGKKKSCTYHNKSSAYLMCN
ncbi:hypothetical protein Q9233_005431 [Columba guinea]|nr:hypothetical protein Q9233_005431 [Columba guinea]